MLSQGRIKADEEHATNRAHPTFDEYWKDRAITPRVSDITVPVLAIGGWDDEYFRAGTLASIEGALDRTWVIYGPWEHSPPVDLGAGVNVEDPLPAGVLLAWFDRWVKEMPDAPIPETSTFTSYEGPKGVGRGRRGVDAVAAARRARLIPAEDVGGPLPVLTAASVQVGGQQAGGDQHGPAPGDESRAPPRQGLLESFRSGLVAEVIEDGGDVDEAVATPAEQVGQLGVAHVGGGVATVACGRVASGAQQTGALPRAQRGGPQAQAVGQLADGERHVGGGGRRDARQQQPGGGLDGFERLAVALEEGVTAVDGGEGAVEVASVHGHHDRTGGGMAVGGHQGHERSQGLGVLGPEAAVAGLAAGRRGQEAVALVVAHGLGGQAVPSGQVDGTHGSSPCLRLLAVIGLYFGEKFTWVIQRYRRRAWRTSPCPPP
jgi:hypothetical protein